MTSADRSGAPDPTRRESAVDLFGGTPGPAPQGAVGEVADGATAEAADVARLKGVLADRAAAAGLLDVAYRILPSPVGDLLVATTATGLVRVGFAPGPERVDALLDELAREVSPNVVAAARRLDPVARQFDDWFAGRRRRFDLDLDLRLVSGFRRRVVAALPTIPWGTTATYAQVATRVGSPRAVRAVGTACARNPLPVVVPCHRVVRSDGTLGGYAGGPDAKRTLLGLEGVVADV
jgi:methylated-DNA-[protein]-cysteine S-methyltransferase